MSIETILARANETEGVVLLRNREVVRWVLGDKSFLRKDTETEWGKSMLRLKTEHVPHTQWTNNFGEYIVHEIYLIKGKRIWKPKSINRLRPDRETEDSIIEVKTGTYFTDGTAHEKILGTPFKYADVPEIYGKNLKIICVGRAETECRRNYGNLTGQKTSEKKRVFLEFFKEHGIEFIGASDLLRDL